ncbi:hypothetical protein OB905_10270 [Halobacteria archaeon AArc-dxtr1]|nr:hypothetical protein [Halobacteria archaeon AArc-dxtr1]
MTPDPRTARNAGETDGDWELYVREGVVVAEFPEGMPSERSEYEEVNRQFEELASRSDAHAHLSWLKMDAALTVDVFEKATEAAAMGTDHGITKWVMVSDGIKNLALRSQINDVPGVETHVADSFEEGMEWATQ